MQNTRIILVLAVVVLAGCSNKPDSTADGKTLYNYHCSGCHKEDGHGRFLSGVPANSNTHMSRFAVKRLITQGHKSKPSMQPIEGLTEPEADKIVNYLWRLRSKS